MHLYTSVCVCANLVSWMMKQETCLFLSFLPLLLLSLGNVKSRKKSCLWHSWICLPYYSGQNVMDVLESEALSRINTSIYRDSEMSLEIRDQHTLKCTNHSRVTNHWTTKVATLICSARAHVMQHSCHGRVLQSSNKISDVQKRVKWMLLRGIHGHYTEDTERYWVLKPRSPKLSLR